jgi:hypothetical protein
LHSFSVLFCVSPAREGICAVMVGSVLAISYRMSSGPRTGPRKNLEYSPRRAVSRFAKERRDGRGADELGVASGHVAGVDAPEEAGVHATGGRLHSIPVEVCLSSKVEERVTFVCRVFQTRRGAVNKVLLTPDCGRSSSSSSLEKHSI